MKRRDFIKHIPLGLAAASIPFSVGGFSGRAFGKSPMLDALLNTQGDTDRVLVLINLQGGNDGLNMVIPFEDPLYASNRAGIGFTSAGDKASLANYKLRTDLALNPVMGITPGQNPTPTKFMDMFTNGKLAVLQNVGYTNPNRSHFRATDIWNSGTDSNLVISTGWLGRYLETLVPEDYPLSINSPDPVAISIDYSTSLAFQGDKSVMALAVTDPSKYSAAANYPDDTNPANNFGNELSFVRGVLQQSDVYGARFASVFSNANATKNKVAYSTTNNLAQQLKKVAWCINAGMTTKVYFVSLSGFDTHVNENSKNTAQGQGLLLSMLAEAISTFQQDIELMGVADRVLGMTYSEFGRRVNQNGSSGTDHGTCAPMFVFGNGVNGEVYGRHPDLKNLDIYADLVNQFDFRQVYASLLTQWFGANDTLRKSILNKPEFSTQAEFLSQFPINGSGTMQNLIKNPINGVSPTSRPASAILYQNYPNPVRSHTEIRFDLAEGSRVTLEVFDARGELMATLADTYHGSGTYTIPFDASRLASGTYYYRLDAAGVVESRAMTIVR